MSDDKKPEPKKKPGFWKSLGNASIELIGSFLYQGPR
jgi:hypothetical protein